MSDFEIRVHTDAFRSWIHRAGDDAQAAARQVFGQGVGFALQHARATQSFKDRTGELRRSIVRGATSPWSLFLKATAPHAAYVEYGTRAHPIVPVRARMLRFIQHGAVQFRRRVQHPGTKPRHFMVQAGEVAKKYYDYFMEDAIARAFR